MASPDDGNPDASIRATGNSIDWVEVGRVGYQLELDHGRNAYTYAGKLAEQAAKRGDEHGSEFWRAVSSSLAPRDPSIS